jgi:uncharacterized RDD family membrane protein YckC
VGGRDFEFGEGEVTLGRSRTATVRVEHESVSRSHALLTFERGKALLKDLNSSNGTFAAGRRVLNETHLPDRETIQLGAAVVLYRVLAPDQPSERTAMIDGGVGTIPAPVLLEASSEPPAGPDEVPANGDGPTSLEADGAPSSPPDVEEPRAAGPFEISADDLVQSSSRKEGREETPLASQSALDAVRNVPDAMPGFPAPPPAPPAPAPAPVRASLPVPPRSPRPSSVAEVPLSDYLERSVAAAASPGAPAGFGQRLLAALVDGVILSAINFVLLSPVVLVSVFLGVQRGPAAPPRWEVLAITALSFLLIVAADLWYSVGGLARSGRTPGKALMKIVVVGPAGTTGTGIGYGKAFTRLLFQAIGSIPFGLGSLVMLLRKDRRTWHDVMSGTWVIRVG